MARFRWHADYFDGPEGGHCARREIISADNAGEAEKLAVADIGALEKFILEQLTPIPGIEKIRSSFALKQVRYKTALPLPRVA